MTSRLLKEDLPVWVVVALVGAPLVGVVATLWPALHFAWSERTTYSHGYLVLAIAGWLAYREFRREPLRAGNPSVCGCIAVAGCLTVAFAGRAADVALFSQLAIPAVALSSVWAAAGWRSAQRFFVPAAFTGFAMPFWDVINDRLRDLTVFVVGAFARQSAIPALIEGNLIRIPSGTFEVAGGCSGLHFLIVGSALGVLTALLGFRRLTVRIAIVATAIALALVANWIRVFTIIVAGHLTDMQHYLVTVDHYYFGWVLFVAIFSLLFVAGRLLERVDPILDEPAPMSLGRQLQTRVARVDWKVVTTALLLVGGIGLLIVAGARPAGETVRGPIELPGQIGPWLHVGSWTEGSRPYFVGPDQTGSAEYLQSGERVSAYVANIAVQDQGREIVYYANLPQGPQGQITGRATVRTGPDGDGGAVFAELQVGGPEQTRRLVWYVYRIAGVRTSAAALAKLYQVPGVLRGRWDAQVLVMSATCEPDCAAARDSLGKFASEAETPLFAAGTAGLER